jgi:hypothetical protein
MLTGLQSLADVSAGRFDPAHDLDDDRDLRILYDLIPVRSEGTSGFSEGRFVLEKDIEHRPNGASGDHNVSSAAPSHISSTAVVGRTEIPSCVQVSLSTKPPCFYLEVVYCNKLIDAVISRKS